MEGKAQPMFLSCTSRRIDPGSQSVVKVRSAPIADEKTFLIGWS